MNSILKSRRFKSQVIQILWITFFWVLIVSFEIQLEFSIINFLRLEYNPKDIWSGLTLNIFSALMAGLIGGSFLVFFWNYWLRSLSYGRSLLAIFITYTIIFIIVFFAVNLLSETTNMYDDIYPDEISPVLFSGIFTTYLKWLILSLFTLILLQVNDKYGPGVFKDFILGKYFQPRKEERVFMFLDLKSSTSIAEKLGEEQYFKFLRACFRTVTPAMVESRGEVYQYVGDEMVISWKVNNKFNALDCVNSYFRMQAALDQNEDFIGTFSIKGVIKREIAYSGDVLNTTARIQAKCNEFNAALLISSYVQNMLPGNAQNQIIPIGKIDLRGREESLELYKVKDLLSKI